MAGVFLNLISMRFPLKLYHMLENEKYNHIISWLPDGDSFSILDGALLVRDVLPFYCPGARYESFIRQLNKYGFETLEKRKKTDVGRIFSSPLFIRGREDLVLTMKRIGTVASLKTKATEAAPSSPSKRSKHDSLPNPDSSLTNTLLSGPSFNNIRSFLSSASIEPANSQAETAALAHTSTVSTGHWLTQKVVVTRVTETVKCTFIPHDLPSQPLCSNALKTVANSIFSSEQLLSREADSAHHSSSGDNGAYESTTVLDTRVGPIEYAVAHAPAGFKGTFLAPSTLTVAAGSDGEAAKWPQQLLQSLGVSDSKEAIVFTGSTTLYSALPDIITAVSAAVQSCANLSERSLQALSTDQEEGQTDSSVNTTEMRA